MYWVCLMSLNVPQLNPDVFLLLIVLLSYTPPSAAAAPLADNEDPYLQLLSASAASH